MDILPLIDVLYTNNQESFKMENQAKLNIHIKFINLRENYNIKEAYGDKKLNNNNDDSWLENYIDKLKKDQLIEIDQIPDEDWDWKEISKNSNLTMKFVEKHIGKSWDWNAISVLPNIKMEFIENLNTDQFQNISRFFDGMPSLKHILKFTCSECEHKNEVELKGIQSFFT